MAEHFPHNIHFFASVSDILLIFSFQTKISAMGNTLTLNFSYPKEPTLSTSKIYYTQYNSFNYTPIEKSRTDDFDNFLINSSFEGKFFAVFSTIHRLSPKRSS